MKFLQFTVFAYFFSNVSGHVLMNYSNVEAFGDKCPQFDSCKFHLSTGKTASVLSVQRNCACDPLCLDYGDCCIDMPENKLEDNNSKFKCFEIPEYGGVYMIDSCPSSYEGPQNVKNLCENTKLGDKKDPLGSLPVTDSLTGMTYKNYFCSMCNGKYENMVLWSPKLDCTLLQYFNSSGNLTEKYIVNNLATDGQNWGVYLKDEYGSSLFHECDIDVSMPPALKNKIRLCKPDLISDCPLNWNDAEVRMMCKSYMGVKFARGGRGYKNIHCAICNRESLSDISCESGDIDMIDIFRFFKGMSFAFLIDFSEATGPTVGMVQMCNSQAVYDPFFHKCRNVLCLPGFVRRGNRCEPGDETSIFNQGKKGTIKRRKPKKPEIRFSEWKKSFLSSTINSGKVEKFTTLQQGTLQTSTTTYSNQENITTTYMSLQTSTENPAVTEESTTLQTSTDNSTATAESTHLQTSTENSTITAESTPLQTSTENSTVTEQSATLQTSTEN